MNTAALTLYSFWRSSAAYRVRIALNLKGLAYATVSTNLAPGVQEQKSEAFRRVNPQGFVPALVEGAEVLGESLAIIEYLDERHPEPALLPADPLARARVRWLAQLVACDIHPLNNARVLAYLKDVLGQPTETVEKWYRHWICEGFAALEILARQHSGDGTRLFGDAVTLADVCLVPQMYNARRFNTPLDAFPTLTGICAALEPLPAFAAARPELQPDAPR